MSVSARDKSQRLIILLAMLISATQLSLSSDVAASNMILPPVVVVRRIRFTFNFNNLCQREDRMITCLHECTLIYFRSIAHNFYSSEYLLTLMIACFLE